MAKYESTVKFIAAPQSVVYAKLSDLSNVGAIKERLGDAENLEKLNAMGGNKLDEKQMKMAKEQLQSLQYTEDTISVNVPPVGNISLSIVERTPEKCIKFQSTQSPVSFKAWIQLLPVTSTECKMKLTIDAELNMFIKMMVDKKLKQGVEQLATMLASIPYGY